jgi:hypothetical protein
MKKRMLRAVFVAVAVSAIALLVGCSKQDTGDVKAEAAKVDEGLKGQPPVPDNLKGLNLKEEGSPIGKKGGGP